MNISIPQSHVSHLKEAYQKIYEDYLERKKAMETEWADLAPMLSSLGIPVNGHALKPKTFSVVDKGDYRENMSWLQKAKAILRIKAIPLTSNEIIDRMIKEFEPSLSRQAVMNSLPATLSVAAKENKIDRRMRAGTNEYEYFVKG